MNRVDPYFSHFLDHSIREVRDRKPERLKRRLLSIQELFEGTLAASQSVRDTATSSVTEGYLNLFEDALRVGDRTAQSYVCYSLRALYGLAWSYGRARTCEALTNAIPRFYLLVAEDGEGEGASEHVLGALKNVRAHAFRSLDGAASIEELRFAMNLVDRLLSAHRLTWRKAIETSRSEDLRLLHAQLAETRYLLSGGYSPPPGREDVDEVRTRKARALEAIQRDIEQLKFVSYAWAWRLYDDGLLSETFLRTVFEDHLPNEMETVAGLSRVYLSMVAGGTHEDYWFRWHLDYETRGATGAVVSGHPVTGWLRDFYCVAAIHLLSTDSAISRLQEARPPAVGVPFDGLGASDLSGIQDRLGELVETDRVPVFPIDEGPSLVTRYTTLDDYLARGKVALEEQQREAVRQMDVDPEVVLELQEEVNRQIRNTPIRRALEALGAIDQSEVEEPGLEGFERYWTTARELFVDDGVPTHFTNTFSALRGAYEEFVLDQLSLLTRSLVPAEELPEIVEDAIWKWPTGALVAGNDRVLAILEGDVRGKRLQGPRSPARYEFSGVPLFRGNSERYDLLILFEPDFEYVEPAPDTPFAVEVCPGEDVFEEDQMELGQIREDFVAVTFRYRARITPSEGDGVMLTLEEASG